MIAHAAAFALISLLGGMPNRTTYTPPISGTQPATNANTPSDAGAPQPPPDAGPPKPQLTSAQVLQTLQAHRPKIQKCYEVEARKKPGLEGKVDVTFTIQTSGAVTDAAIKNSTINDDAVHKCILAELSTVKFDPSPPNPVALGYGWSFETKSLQ